VTPFASGGLLRVEQRDAVHDSKRGGAASETRVTKFA
jgi:hypothetical protein